MHRFTYNSIIETWQTFSINLANRIDSEYDTLSWQQSTF